MNSNEKFFRVGDYILKQTLGTGTFSKVKLAVHEKTGQEYACKILDKEYVKQRAWASQVQREVSVMRTLQHPNTVQLIAVLASKYKVFIIMELVTGGELFTEIESHGRLTEPYARFYFRQLVDGLQYCHNHGVYHRDLKPENLLLGKNGQLKITDFGLSFLKENAPDSDKSVTKSFALHTQCGTPNYVAPEIITVTANGYSGGASDAWSCGIILYVLCAGRLPFDSEETETLFRSILQGHVHFPSHFSPELRDLISHLLKTKPRQRYRLAHVKMHPWFTREEVETSMPRGLILPLEMRLGSDTERSSEKDDVSYQNTHSEHSDIQQQPVERSDYASTETESLGSRHRDPSSLSHDEQDLLPNVENISSENDSTPGFERMSSTDTLDDSIKAKRVDEVPVINEQELAPNGSVFPEQDFEDNEAEHHFHVSTSYEGSTRTASEADVGYYTSGAATTSGNDSDDDHEEDEFDDDMAGVSSVDFQTHTDIADNPELHNHVPIPMPYLLDEQRSESPSPEIQPDYSQEMSPQVYTSGRLPPCSVAPGTMNSGSYSIQQAVQFEPSPRYYVTESTINTSTFMPTSTPASEVRPVIDPVTFDANGSLSKSVSSRPGRRSLLAESPIQREELSFPQGQGMTPLSNNLVSSEPKSKSVHFSTQEPRSSVHRFFERNGVCSDSSMLSSDDERHYRDVKPVVPGQSSQFGGLGALTGASESSTGRRSYSLNDLSNLSPVPAYSSDGSSKPGGSAQNSHVVGVRRELWDRDQSWRFSSQMCFLDGGSETDVTAPNSLTLHKIIDDVNRLYSEESDSINEPPKTQNSNSSDYNDMANNAIHNVRNNPADMSERVGNLSSLRMIRSSSHDGKIAERSQNRIVKSASQSQRTKSLVSNHSPPAEAVKLPVLGSYDRANCDSINEHIRPTVGSSKINEKDAKPQPTRRKVLRFADMDGVSDGTTQSNRRWVKSASDAVVWSEMMKDFDMIPDEVEFGMTTEALSHMWQKGMEKESITKTESFSNYFLKSNTYVQSRSTRKLSTQHINQHKRSAGGLEAAKRRKGSIPRETEQNSREVNFENSTYATGPSLITEHASGGRSPKIRHSARPDSAEEDLVNHIPGGRVPTRRNLPATSVSPNEWKGQTSQEGEDSDLNFFNNQSSALPNTAMMSHPILNTESRTNRHKLGVEERKGDGISSASTRENLSIANGYEDGHGTFHAPVHNHVTYRDASNEMQEVVGSTASSNQIIDTPQSIPFDIEGSGIENNERLCPSATRIDIWGINSNLNRSGNNERDVNPHNPNKDEVLYDRITAEEVNNLPVKTPERSEDMLSSSPTTPGADYASNLRSGTESPHLNPKSGTSDGRQSVGWNSGEEDGALPPPGIISRDVNVSLIEERPESQGLREIIPGRGAGSSASDHIRPVDDENVKQIADIVHRYNQAQAQGRTNPINPFHLDIPSPKGKPPPSRTLLMRIPTLGAFLRKRLQKRLDYRRGLNFQSFLKPAESLDVVRDVLKENNCDSSVSLKKSSRQKVKFVWNDSHRTRHAEIQICSAVEAEGTLLQFRRVRRELSTTDDEEFISFYKKIRKGYSEKAKEIYARRNEGNSEHDKQSHRQKRTKNKDEENEDDEDQSKINSAPRGQAESSDDMEMNKTSRTASTGHFEGSHVTQDTLHLDSCMESPL